jgi:N-methylhydantoinase A
VIPNHAGNFSAWVLLEQDMVRSAALTIVAPLNADGLATAEEALAKLFRQLDERAERRVGGAVTHEAEFDLRYEGQEYSLALSVPIAGDRFTETPERIAACFAADYERTYGHSFEVGVTIVSVRAIERTALPRPSDTARSAAPGAQRTGATERAFSFAADDWLDFEVIDRASLAPGDTFAGPAIVLEPTTTTYVDTGLRGRVHDTGVLLLTKGA